MAHWMIRHPKTDRPIQTRRAAVKHATGAAKVVKVEGGYMAFEFVRDFEVWKNQR